MSTAEFLSAYDNIKAANKTALTQIETAKALERQDQPLKAIAAYKQGLKLIDKLFAIPVGLPDDGDNGIEAQWNDACAIIQTLQEIKVDVIQRLDELKSQHLLVDVEGAEDEVVQQRVEAEQERVESEQERVRAEQTHVAENTTTSTFKKIVKDLREVLADKDVAVAYDTLFQAQIKLYKIQSNGVVQTAAGETSMSLVMCNIGDKWSHLNGIYFIQCSMPEQGLESKEEPSTSQTDNMVWIYPLLPNITFYYRTEYKAFIFSDLEAADAGSAFGITLSKPTELTEEQFIDMEQFFLDLLEAVLFKTLKSTRNERCSEKVSRNIVAAADFIATNLVKGAEKTADLMKQSTPYILTKIKPAPQNPSNVPQGVQTTVEVAKDVTNSAVDLTGWVAWKVGEASCAVGRYLAPHIQSNGTTILQKTCGMDEQEATEKMDGVFNVATGAAEGFGRLFHGLGKAAYILGTNLKENSVKIVEYRYGSSAGSVTADTFDSFGNVFVVSHNVHYMMPAGMAKKAGFAVVDEYNQNRKGESQRNRGENLNTELRTAKDTTEKSRGS